jgi:hypothetical protein
MLQATSVGKRETKHRLAVDALGATHALLGCPWMEGDKHEIGWES